MYRFVVVVVVVVVVWCTEISSIHHYCTSVVSNNRLKTVG